MTAPEARRDMVFERADVVCREGEVPDCFYTLKSGRLAVVVGPRAHAELDGEELLRRGRSVAVIDQRGALVGESGAFLSRRIGSVIALEKSVLTAVPLQTQGIDEAIGRKPALGIALARSIAQRLRDTDEQLRDVRTLTEEVQEAIDQYAHRFHRTVDEITRRGDVPDPTRADVGKHTRTFAYQHGTRSGRGRRRAAAEDTGASVGRFNTKALEEAMEAKGRGKVRIFNRGEVVCKEGDPSDEMYVLMQGNLAVDVHGETVATLEEGEILGEMAILLGERTPRTATVTANTFSKLGVIPRDKFEPLVEVHPTFIIQIARTLAKRLAATNATLQEHDHEMREALERLNGGYDSVGQAYGDLVGTLGEHDEHVANEAASMLQEYESLVVAAQDFQKRREAMERAATGEDDAEAEDGAFE